MALTTEEVDLCNQSLGKIGAKRFDFGDTSSTPSVQCLLHFEQTRDALLRTFEWPFGKTRLRLVSAWLTDTTYTTDQYVWQSSLLYKAILAHTSDVFATDLTNLNWTLVSTIDAWVTATAYVVGDLVTTNALLYKCLVAHTSGTFSTDLAAGKWVLSTTKPVNVFGFNYDIPANSLRLVQVNSGHVLGHHHHHHNHEDAHHWTLETNTILTDLVEVDIVYIDKITTTTEWDSLFTEFFICTLAFKLLGPLAGMGSAAIRLRDELRKELKELRKQTRAVGSDEGNNAGDSNWNNARFRGRLGVHSERFW